MTRYRVDCGRSIIDTTTGKEIFYIKRGEGFIPTEADAMTYFICGLLNGTKKEFELFYKGYIEK